MRMTRATASPMARPLVSNRAISVDPSAVWTWRSLGSASRLDAAMATTDGTASSGNAHRHAPSPETVAGGTYRPLSRPIFIYAKVKALERPEVREFVDFYLTQGGTLVREVGYIPMTERELELTRARFTARKTGTMFTGTDSHSEVTLEQRLTR